MTNFRFIYGLTQEPGMSKQVQIVHKVHFRLIQYLSKDVFCNIINYNFIINIINYNL